MSSDPNSPVEPKGWAIVGATATGIVIYILRPLSTSALNALLIVISGLGAGILFHELEYQILKHNRSGGTGSPERDVDEPTEELDRIHERMDRLQDQLDELESTLDEGSGDSAPSPADRSMSMLDQDDQQLNRRQSFDPPEWFVDQANLSDPDIYDEFDETWPDCWKRAAELLDWERAYEEVLGTEHAPFYEWFAGGTLNAAYNCVDRHVEQGLKNQSAIQWVGDDGSTQTLTYQDLYRKINEFAAALQSSGVEEDDVVTVHLPTIPELPIVMLACARIGALHSVLFAGISAEELAVRMNEADSEYLITFDGHRQRGDEVRQKSKVSKALEHIEHDVSDVVVVNHLDDRVEESLGDETHIFENLCQDHTGITVAPTERNSDDPLYLLYIYDSKGELKGIQHTTGGYLSYVTWTSYAVLDLKSEDTFWCAADFGWTPSHSYGVYGALALGATTVMYEGPIYSPEKDSFWKVIEKNAVDILYTTPPTIHSLMDFGEEYPAQYDLSSIRLIGSLAKPMDPHTWMWYYEHVGNGDCVVVDTYWRTSTGGIMAATLPGISEMKPGSVGPPLPGIDLRVVDANGEEVSAGDAGHVTIRNPWPGVLATLAGNDERFLTEYWPQFSDKDNDEWIFATKSTARIDKDGYIIFLDRRHEIMDIAGDRFDTQELESAIVDVSGVAEAIVVDVSDEIHSTAVYVFCVPGFESDLKSLEETIERSVERTIGSFARPERIIFCQDLPKTRWGEIVRSVLEDIASGRQVSDLWKVKNPNVISYLEGAVETHENNSGSSNQ
jgi:acetyl-CoA synthetase